jgi:hypothetical protein
VQATKSPPRRKFVRASGDLFGTFRIANRLQYSRRRGCGKPYFKGLGAPIWTRSFPIAKEPAALGQHLKKKRFLAGVRQREPLGVAHRTVNVKFHQQDVLD